VGEARFLAGEFSLVADVVVGIELAFEEFEQVVGEAE